MNAKKRKKRPLKHHDPEVNHHHLSSGDYIFIKKDNAMSNKLEQRALEQINKIDEGLFSGLFKGILGKKMVKELDKAAKDPQMRGAFANFEKSVEDLEHATEVYIRTIAEEQFEKESDIPKNLEGKYRKIALDVIKRKQKLAKKK